MTVLSGNSIENASIAVLDLESSRLSDALVRGAVGARYVPRSAGSGGYLVYAKDRQGRLSMREFDPGTREIAAVPTDIPGVAVQVAGTYLAAAFDISDTGALLYVGPRPAAQARLVWIDHDGVEETIDAALPGVAGYPRVSPDGERVAFDIGVGTTGRRIWTMDLKRGIPVRLSESGDDRPLYEDFQALWSRDGARVYFASLRTGDFQIWSHAADGTGSDVRLIDNPDVIVPLASTPDDRLVVMRGPYPQADIGLLDPADPARVEWLIESRFSEITPSVSPDGRWIAYASNEIGGRYEIFVQSFPSGGVRERISRNGAAYPAWSPDGELYYIGFDASGNPAMMAATLSTSNGLGIVAERVLFRKPVLTPFTQGGGLRPYDVSQIDGRILIALPVSSEFDPFTGRMTIWRMSNWIEAL